MWYAARGQQRKGPFSDKEFKQYVASGQLDKSDLVWSEKIGSWMPLDQLSSFPGSPPPLPDTTPPPQVIAAANFTSAPSSSDSSTWDNLGLIDYFGTHWKGGLSLSLSFWLSGAFHIFLVGIITAMIEETGRLSILGPILILTSLIWLLTGLWRSSTRLIADPTYKMKFWPYVIRVVIGFLIFCVIAVAVIGAISAIGAEA